MRLTVLSKHKTKQQPRLIQKNIENNNNIHNHTHTQPLTHTLVAAIVAKL